MISCVRKILRACVTVYSAVAYSSAYKMPAYFIATAHSMIIDMLDSRGVFGSANNALCRGFCTSFMTATKTNSVACTLSAAGGPSRHEQGAGQAPTYDDAILLLLLLLLTHTRIDANVKMKERKNK